MQPLRPVASSREALASWNAELAFRSVVEATADEAGLDFMRHLVKNLARSLGVAHAFVAEFAGAEERVRTIAFWSGGDWAPNVEYPLFGTPCERVIAGGFCLYTDDVQKLFPADSDLVALGVRSYLGVPLRGADGRTLGHLAALDNEPMQEDPRGLAIFEVFANRARVEIERLHAEAVLVRACSDLEVRLETPERALPSAQTLDTIQRLHIADMLARTDWVIEGPEGAASLLGMQPSTLRSRMKKLGVRRPSAG